MATITLTRREAERGDLPPVCALTGEPTDDVKHRTFVWQPAWVYALIPLGLLPCLIVSLIIRKTMTLRLPLVRRKHFHWGWRMAVAAVGIVASAGAFIVGGALVSDYERGTLGGWLMIGGLVGFVLSLVMLAVLTALGIHPKRITDREITLAGVHDNFVAAVEEDRERDEADYQREKEQLREERDRRTREREEVDQQGPVPRARRVKPSEDASGERPA